MHALDIGIFIIAILLVVTGIRRGLIGEVIRLLAMIGGCGIAFMYFHDCATHAPFKNLPMQQNIKGAIAFLAIFLLSFCLIVTIGWFVKKIIHLTPLGWLDRLVGGVIGVLKTLLIAYVACLSISTLPARKIRNDFNKSLIYRTYTALPEGLTLKSLLKKRRHIRTIFNKHPHSGIDTMQLKFDKFKATVDSAKEVQSYMRKD